MPRAGGTPAARPRVAARPRRACPTPVGSSPESAGDVVLGEAVPRVGEYPVGGAHLDQLSEVEVRSALRYARRLLHRVRDDHDRILFAQLIDQILDARGGNGIERGAGLVHENHFGLYGDGARNAQALLLAAREPGAGAAQAVLHLIPEPGARQAGAHDVIELRAAACQAMDARTVGDVVVDRFRERVRLLEHHADTRTQLRRVLALIVDVAAVEPDRAGDTRARDRIVHAIEAAQECRLAAPGRADHRQHLAARDVERDILQRLLGAVEHAHVAACEQRILDRGFRLARRVSRGGGVHAAAGLEIQPTFADTLSCDVLWGGAAVAGGRNRGASGARGRGPLRLRRLRILSRIFR